MIKKLVLCGGIGLAALGLTFGRDAWSYVATGWDRMHGRLREQIPVEFELDRARQMIERLEPEIRRNMHLIAKEEVGIERLSAEVAELQSDLAAEKANLLQLSADLEQGETALVYAGRTYTPDEVREDLANRFDRYKVNEQTLEHLRSVLHSRQKGLDAARQNLEQMVQMKQQLLAEVANLDARQKMVQVAQTSSRLALDQSQLARTKRMIDDLEARIAVSERVVVAERDFGGTIPVNQPADDQIASEIASYFKSHEDRVVLDHDAVTPEPVARAER